LSIQTHAYQFWLSHKEARLYVQTLSQIFDNMMLTPKIVELLW